jgi:hypothetical protein
MTKRRTKAAKARVDELATVAPNVFLEVMDELSMLSADEIRIAVRRLFRDHPERVLTACYVLKAITLSPSERREARRQPLREERAGTDWSQRFDDVPDENERRRPGGRQ